MKKIFSICFATLILTSCRSTSNTSSPSFQFLSPKPNFIFNDLIQGTNKVCIKKDAGVAFSDESLQQITRRAFSLWLFQLTNHISSISPWASFSCEGKLLATIKIHHKAGRAHIYRYGRTVIIYDQEEYYVHKTGTEKTSKQITKDQLFETITHELGHILHLGDTYLEKKLASGRKKFMTQPAHLASRMNGEIEFLSKDVLGVDDTIGLLNAYGNSSIAARKKVWDNIDDGNVPRWKLIEKIIMSTGGNISTSCYYHQIKQVFNALNQLTKKQLVALSKHRNNNGLIFYLSQSTTRSLDIDQKTDNTIMIDYYHGSIPSVDHIIEDAYTSVHDNSPHKCTAQSSEKIITKLKELHDFPVESEDHLPESKVTKPILITKWWQKTGYQKFFKALNYEDEKNAAMFSQKYFNSLPHIPLTPSGYKNLNGPRKPLRKARLANCSETQKFICEAAEYVSFKDENSFEILSKDGQQVLSEFNGNCDFIRCVGVLEKDSDNVFEFYFETKLPVEYQKK